MRVTIPSKHLRSEDRFRSLQPLSRRAYDRRRARLQHHAQRASPDRDLSRRRRAADGCHPGAADQEGSHLHSRQSDRQPRRSDPHRRGNGDDRQHLTRTARRRHRARGAVRDIRRQHQSDADAGAALGRRRPDREGLDQPRRAVQLRRPLHASARGERMATPLPAAASDDLDHRFERLRQHQEGGEPGLRVRNLPAAA